MKKVKVTVTLQADFDLEVNPNSTLARDAQIEMQKTYMRKMLREIMGGMVAVGKCSNLKISIDEKNHRVNSNCTSS